MADLVTLARFGPSYNLHGSLLEPSKSLHRTLMDPFADTRALKPKPPKPFS